MNNYKLKRRNVQNFNDSVHEHIGASETIPNLTLPVHDLFERLTDHTLDGIRAASLLTENVSIPKDITVDQMAERFDYVDRLCLAENPIDLTDKAEITRLLKSQLSESVERARAAAAAKAQAKQIVPATNVPSPEPTKTVVVE